MSMRRKIIFTISVVFIVISVCIYFFVFKASGSDSAVSIEGCNPYNVEVKKAEGANSVVISWRSKESCPGYVIYGSEMKDLNLVGIDLEGGVKGSEHTVVIDALISSKVYFFSIVSDGVTYGKDGLPISFSISSL